MRRYFSFYEANLDSWVWLCMVYLSYADYELPTKYHSRIDGLIKPIPDDYFIVENNCFLGD